MIAYRVGIIPLIKNLKRKISDVTHTWYADDAGALGTFTIIDTYFDSLTRQGLGRLYYDEPSKSIFIVRLENIEAGKYFEASHTFKACTGARYLGSYTGDNESKNDWLRERKLAWEKNINTIRHRPQIGV